MCSRTGLLILLARSCQLKEEGRRSTAAVAGASWKAEGTLPHMPSALWTLMPAAAAVAEKDHQDRCIDTCCSSPSSLLDSNSDPHKPCDSLLLP